MRLKKQRRHRKVVRFYSACFGFREPYKVLCDGTFIHHLLVHGLTPADDSLSSLLGGRVLLFTTRCVIEELKSLGESHSEAFEAAHQLMTASYLSPLLLLFILLFLTEDFFSLGFLLFFCVDLRCDHENRVDAEACIQSIIGESNSEHFFFASLDSEIRKKFREVPGVPIIYGLRNTLFLEQPTLNQQRFVKSTEEKRLHMNESEYQKIYKRESKHKLASDGADSPSANDKFTERNWNTKRTFGVVDKVRFKIKKAKGPNPLSCKKKKQKVDTSVTKNQGGVASTAGTRKRIRKRKRAHKDESKFGQTKI